MKRFFDFVKLHIAIINWTAGYLFVYYAIFRLLFGFDALSADAWVVLSSAHLRGVTGLAFAVLMSAFLPLYLASVFIIKRTRKLPIDMPKLPKSKKSKAAAFKKSDLPPPEIAPEKETELPKMLPDELRAPYLQMMRGTLAKNATNTAPSNFAKASAAPTVYQPEPKQEKIENIASAMTIPDDFEVESKPAAPAFKEMSLSDTEKKDENPYEKALFEAGYKIRKDGDVIIARKSGTNYAIVVHDDADAWVADEDQWFANGKQKESPIKMLKDSAGRNGAEAILLLAAKNIVDLDKQREKWTAADVRTIKNISEI